MGNALSTAPMCEPCHKKDTSLPTRIKVTKKMDVLKTHKATGLDWVSPRILKYGGEMLTLELTKLMGSIWVKEQFPKNRRELVVVPIYEKDGRCLCENQRNWCSNCPIQAARRSYFPLIVLHTRKMYSRELVGFPTRSGLYWPNLR